VIRADDLVAEGDIGAGPEEERTVVGQPPKEEIWVARS
jgi:hypothetical protein